MEEHPDQLDAEHQALDVEQLQRQVADQARRLSALHEILEALSTPGELPVTLKMSLRAALIAVRGNAGFIHLREKSGKFMRLVAVEGVSDSVIEALTTVSTGEGLVAWVAHSRETLIVPNIDEDDRTFYLATNDGLKTFLGVPISRGPRVWGTLSVLGSEPSLFGEGEVALLSSVGEEIGLVVDNVRLRRRAEQLLLVQERNRLARDLHDSVTQSLYSITLFAEAGRRRALEGEQLSLAGKFSQIGETGQQALKEMRLMLYRLRPSNLAAEGLERALQHRLNSVEGRAGVKSQFVVKGTAKLSPEAEDTLYQIALEALNNALKHAMASEVVVQLDLTNAEKATLRIEDNGRGFDPETVTDSDGMGILNMQERAQSLDGELTVRSVPGEGTVVLACVGPSGEISGQRADFNVEDLS